MASLFNRTLLSFGIVSVFLCPHTALAADTARSQVLPAGTVYAAKLNRKLIAYCRLSETLVIEAGTFSPDGQFTPYDILALQQKINDITLLLSNNSLTPNEKKSLKKERKALKKQLSVIAKEAKACRSGASKAASVLGLPFSCNSGDLNSDSQITIGDVALWYHYFITRDQRGNFDGNKVIDPRDLTVLLQLFNGQCTTDPSSGGGASSSSSSGDSSSDGTSSASSQSSNSSGTSSSQSSSSTSSSNSNSSSSSSSSASSEVSSHESSSSSSSSSSQAASSSSNSSSNSSSSLSSTTSSSSLSSSSSSSNSSCTGPLLFEAESMTLTGYRIESNNAASGGLLISRNGAAGAPPGTAEFRFPLQSGRYRFEIRYFDEADGIGSLAASVNGTIVDIWSLDQNFGSNQPDSQTLRSRLISPAIQLNQNDLVTILGMENNTEYARVDAVIFGCDNQSSSSSSMSWSSTSSSSSMSTSSSMSSSSSVSSSSSTSSSAGSSSSSSSVSVESPLAVDNTVYTTVDTMKAFSLPAASRNGAALSYSLASAPVHGTISGVAPHLFYLPQVGFTGEDQLIFAVSAGGQQAQGVINFIVQQPAQYTAPLSIPTPSFGIAQTVQSAYGTMSYYTHWVDNRGNCSDNGNGTATAPRCSIPGNVGAGSVVVIAGGTYSGALDITATGTATQPVIYRGLNQLSRPMIKGKLAIYGAAKYVIVENLALDRDYASSGVNIVGPAHHIALRNSDISDAQGEILIYDNVDNIVVFNNNIHDGGDLSASGDIDDNGIIVGQGTNVWILDNEVRHTVGSGIVLNPGFGEPNSTISRAFVGRNTVHHVRQSGVWSKQSLNSIFSQNTVYGVLVTNHTSADGIGYQYAPEGLWISNNRIFDCEYGIRSGSNSVAALGQNIYIVGNVIHDIHDKRGSFDANNSWSNGGIVLPGGVNRFVYNNIIFNSDSGINLPGDGSYTIQNNIVANVTKTGANHIWIQDEAGNTSWSLRSNLYWQSGSAIRLRFRSTTYTTATLQATYPAKAALNMTADPKFINATAGDFRPQTGSGASPSIDSGTSTSLNSLCTATFGTGCDFDVEGTPRPLDGDADGTPEWDIGAYER